MTQSPTSQLNHPGPTRPTRPTRLCSPKILVVEDEVLLRFSLSEDLQECGFDVVASGSADEAVEIIRHGLGDIDLVFSDIAMPGVMDGVALAQWIHEYRPGLPVILTSGDEKRGASARQLCGRELFFPKPYDLHKVVAQIRAMLMARPHRRSN